MTDVCFGSIATDASRAVPNNVRYAPNSDRILRRSEMTLCANSGHCAPNQIFADTAESTL
jgi:hypothetical protein